MQAVIAVLIHRCRLAAAACISKQRAYFIEFGTVGQQRFAIVHITGLGRQDVAGHQGIGQNANPHALCVQTIEHFHAVVARYQIGRDHQQFRLDSADFRSYLAMH